MKEHYRAVKQGGGNKGLERLSGPFLRSLLQVSVCGRWRTDRDMAGKFTLPIVMPVGWVC